MRLARGALAFLALASVSSVGADDAAPVRVRAEVSDGKVTIGDPVTYTVTIEHPPAVRVRPPGADANLAPFEVRDYRTEQQAGQTRAVYELAVYEVGPQTIPAVDVQYIAQDGQRGVVRTEPVTINVESILPPDAKDIRDIRGPRDVKASPMRPIVGALLALAVLAALLVGVKFWRGRQRPEAEALAPPSPPPRPPEDVAYEELEALARSDLLSRGMVKQYYTELGDILRRYIEGLYDTLALESTTSEIVAELAHASVPTDHIRQFERLLGECDLVKFAKHRPAQERCDDALGDARRIIDMTRPKRVEPTATGTHVGRRRRHDEAGRR